MQNENSLQVKFHANQTHFYMKVLYEDSFSNRGMRQLKNGPFEFPQKLSHETKQNYWKIHQPQIDFFSLHPADKYDPATDCTRSSPNFTQCGLFCLKGRFYGSAHACILTGLCTLFGTGPSFSLFMNQSWASYLILHANSRKIISCRINCMGQH